MNKQSNSYTLIYIVIMALVVGTALAFTAMSLRERQKANAAADKMRQILACVHVLPEEGRVQECFDRYIVDEYVVNAAGEKLPDDAFSVDMASEIKVKDAGERRLPVYVCRLESGVKYILPVYGAGLWGPIWGYLSLDDDASTVYGAYFAHQGETPGLGAEIEKPAFSGQFDGKRLFKEDAFLPIAVLKKGEKPSGGEDYVDGISGGTITSKGLGAMLEDCLSPYEVYLRTLRNE